MSDFPTLREELDRKSFETIEWLSDSLRAGKISEAQYSTGIDALFMATSGLTDESIADLITAASSVAGKQQIKRHFAKGTRIATMVWEPGEAQMCFIKLEAGVIERDSLVKADTPAELLKKMNEIAAKLLQIGYYEL